MTTYKNFYETLKEAEMRLRNTVVLYDGEPYYVIRITDHKDDGIFRIYLDQIGRDDLDIAVQRIPGIPYEYYDGPNYSDYVGPRMDEWLEKNPDSGIIRKMMNSPKFNRFRPFPVGMVNSNGKVLYVERAPVRHTQQGLLQNMLSSTVLSLELPDPRKGTSRSVVDILRRPFRDAVVGEYPSAFECLASLKDPDNINTGAAFDRNFALVKGPANTLFLAYKESIVGFLPNQDFSCVKIGSSFQYTKEVISGLGIFDDIV